MNFLRMGLITAFILFTIPVMAADAPDAPVRDSFFVNIGGTTPVSPEGFTFSNTTGYNGGIGFGFGLSKLFQLVIDANADTFPLNNPPVGITAGGLRVGTLLANIRFRLLAQDNPVVPYLIGGMGGAHVEVNAISDGAGIIDPAYSSNNFAARFGIGIDIRLSPLAALYIESNGYEIFENNSAENFIYNSFRLGGKFNL